MEQTFPFFQTLKTHTEKKDITRSREDQKAFQKLKQILQHLPTLACPSAGETLTIYLSANQEVISAAMLEERDKNQVLVYFISRVLKGAKRNYLIV